MDKQTVIKLRDEYVLFYESDHVLCVYNKREGLVRFKLQCEALWDVKLLIKELLQPNTIGWLLKQKYRNMIGALLKNHPEVFEILDEQRISEEVRNRDTIGLLTKESFLEGFEPNGDFSHSTVVLYGLSKVSLFLERALADLNYKSIILVDNHEVVEVEDILGSDIFCYEQLQKEKFPILKEFYKNNPRVKCIRKEEMEELMELDNCVFLIYQGNQSVHQLLEINQYLASHKKVALYYGMGNEQLVFGPLVIGGESACLSCMNDEGVLEKYYSDSHSKMDSVFLYAVTFFVKRMLCYLKDNHLNMLLMDVQLPMNKIFRIDKYNLNGTVDYMYKNVDCKCLSIEPM